MRDKINLWNPTAPEGDDSNEVEFPRKLQLDKIDNIEFDQVDMNDYPDFSDAYIISADMDGIEMTEEELDKLNENQGFVYEKLIDKLY
jgi:hypothetical protein